MNQIILSTTHGLTVVFDHPTRVTLGKRITISGFTTAAFTKEGKSSTLDLSHDAPEFSIAQRHVKALRVEY
ncbi:MAG: hypothetical protein JRN62_10125 [Nitrososphaerota archaeon]|nr:hypothetical protein [Nitrososphaerota archaeon]MDG6949821.1 hypothetical protein [Nitrososphaerota archaeon]